MIPNQDLFRFLRILSPFFNLQQKECQTHVSRRGSFSDLLKVFFLIIVEGLLPGRIDLSGWEHPSFQSLLYKASRQIHPAGVL